MTITNNAFLAAICEAPEDNTVRLVYADWLEEHGETERAEFIRLQIELASESLEVDHQYRLRHREKALLDAHQAEWRLPFDEKQQPFFTRGFVSQLRPSPAEFLDHGDEYFQAAPITRIGILGDGDGDGVSFVEALTQKTCLQKLRFLDLYSCPIGIDGAKLLFGSSHLRHLHGLHLGEGDTTPEMVSVLSELTTDLRELYLWDFHNGDLGNDGLVRIANSPAFANLTTLNLLQTGVSAEGARTVAESPYLRNLESLSFGQRACGYAPNYIGPEGVAYLANSPQLAGLRQLGLALTRAGSAGLRNLAASSHLMQLKSLDLALSDIDDDGVIALANWPGLASVEWLNLDANTIGSSGFVALANSPYLGRLRTLGLPSNHVDRQGLKALAESPGLSSLRTVWLSWGLRSDVLSVLLGENRFSQLAELYIAGASESDKAKLMAHYGERFQS